MPSKVASLIIRLTDDVSGPAGKAANALRGLANAGDGLSRLKSASAGLDQLGAKMRAARVETEKAAKELAAAQKRAEFFQRSKAAGSHNFPAFEASGLVSEAEARLRAAKRAHAAAERQMRATRGQFVEQKRVVAALSAGMSGAGAGVASLNTALARQPARLAATTSRTASLTKATREMGAAGRETADGVHAVSHAVAGLAAPKATGIAHVTRDLAGLDRRAVTTAKLVRAITAPADLPAMSDGLKVYLAKLGLARGQVGALARGYVRMHGEQAKAVEGIGNPAIRAQVLAADSGTIEDRLRERARAMVAERRVADAIMAPGGSREDRAAVQAARDAAREKIAIARAAAREARQLEREAAREATQGARAAAQVAREAARVKVQAAREAAQAVKAAAREEAAATRAATREAARLALERRRMVADLHGGLRTAAGVVGAGGALYGGGRVARFATRVSAEGTREDARDYLAGVEGDSPRIRRKALDLSLQYQSVDQNTFHERLRDTALAMGSADKAFQVSDSIGKASVVLQSLKGKERSLEEGRRFFAALDNLGKNQDPDQVRRLMDGWLKALGVEGADLDMGSLLQIARKAKSGGGGLSERFLMGVAPALSMDMGPNELGTAIGTEISQLIGGRATKQSKAYQQKIGLRDKKGNFINRDKVVSDPFAYTVEDLIPKLKAAGIDTNSDGAVIEATSKAFSQQTVANLFAKMITQREQYERKLQQYDKAPGLAAADKLATKDPYVAAAGAVSQFGNALQTLAEPIVPAATSALNTFAGGMASLTKAMQDNPEAVKAAAVPAGLAAATLVPQTVGALMKKLAGDATGVLANGLRMGGGALSATGGLLGYGASVGVPTAMGAAANEAPTVNDQGVPNLLAGKESPTARIARELVEARRQQMTPEGRRAALQERIDREHGVIAGLTRAQPEGPTHPAAATIADARARIARLTQERDAIAAGAPVGPAPAAPVSAPTPPARPPEFTLGGISAVPTKLAAYRAELAGIERQLAGLQASGEAAFSPDLAGLEARKAEILAAIAEIEAKLKALKPVAFEVAAPDFAPVVTAGTEGGTQAGVSAGKGVVKGIEQSSPEAIEKGRSLFDRLKSLFQGGIDIPINLNVEGGSGGGVHKVSWVSLPAETRASFVRAAARAGGGGMPAPQGRARLAPSAEPGPGPAVSPQAAFGDGVDVARLPAGMRNNNPGNIKYVGQRNALGPSKNTDQGDPQAVYASPEDGMRALVDLARRKWAGGRQTVSDLVARSGGWTPGNHAAAANIARSAGVGPHDRIDLSDDETMRRFVRGLITQEHGPASRLYSDDLIRRAIRPREPAPVAEAKAAPEKPAIPGMMPGAERVNPGYGRGLHQGGTGLSRYSDDDLRAMAARQDALERARVAAPAPDRLEAARRAIQGRYPATTAPAAVPAPTAVPGLTRPAQGMTPSGVPAIAPKVDLNQVSAAGTQAAATLTQLQGLNTTLTPQVDTSSLSAALALVRSFNAEIAKAGPAMAAAAAQAGSLRAPAGGASGGGEGGAAPASTGMVRRGLANNFA